MSPTGWYEPLPEVDNPTRRFGGLSAASDLGFAVEVGEIRGLIGPNGTGKTMPDGLLDRRAGRGRCRLN